MRAFVQRVTHAQVSVAGSVTGAIPAGLLVYLGVARGDTQSDLDYIARKILGLRLFPDSAGHMNRNLLQAAAPSVLLISQFTLLADTHRGLRPSFDDAAPPAEARPLYEAVAEHLRAGGLTVATGIFQADMLVESVNQGPVTLLLDSRRE